MIPFNKPYFTGKETEYIKHAVELGKISGNGYYTKKCQSFLEEKYGFKKALLTTSGTDALEMTAILADLAPGDEVIMPSYTFVSTANAFVLRGAKIVFADSMEDNPNIDASKIESLVTPKTKAIVVVHYAGFACDMDTVMDIAKRYNLLVIEDAAQAIDNYYIDRNGNKKPLGTIGHLGAFSFHETKNIISGEGGLLTVNDPKYILRSEIIWEKGTNRTAFFRGEVDKYGWVDMGSSFLPSEVTAAFLWAQLEHMDEIQAKRISLWNRYNEKLKPVAEKKGFRLPDTPSYSTNNAHMFYLVCKGIEQQTQIIDTLKTHDILSVFHYSSLHKSDFYKSKHDGRQLEYSDKYTESLVRLPLYYELTEQDVDNIVRIIDGI
ncbi:dTDP-4-amino-4,6-dideoxygalactose transaminase [Dysgonomonas massiliensis]|uniref:dTDP-4-amino-4,6-dideoxygalactose transaminase n=1 Tax=Dysgonomonas massiliensis TaxID=2040292 RepID=UPI000C773742|nr:dTDP-4-amino-4,6-dideoxygalactose transaminase [Dysgonomonas massiliensis]